MLLFSLLLGLLNIWLKDLSEVLNLCHVAYSLRIGVSGFAIGVFTGVFVLISMLIS